MRARARVRLTLAVLAALLLFAALSVSLMSSVPWVPLLALVLIVNLLAANPVMPPVVVTSVYVDETVGSKLAAGPLDPSGNTLHRLRLNVAVDDAVIDSAPTMFTRS